jgi:hypothetical protein
MNFPRREESIWGRPAKVNEKLTVKKEIGPAEF